MAPPIHNGPKVSTTRARPSWKDSQWKNYAIAGIGEFLGTFLFLFFAFGAAQTVKLAYDPSQPTETDPSKAKATAALLLYISLGFGISLAVNVWIFYRISGGIFNPAVTLGVVLLGAMPVVKGGILTIAQLLGGILAAGLIDALLPGPLSVNTTLNPRISLAQGLFIEMFLTFQLIITIYLLAVEKHRATFMAPLVIGLSLFIAHLTGVFFTGASLNPARSLGPAIVSKHFPHEHWIYWVGPGLGSILATGFYKFLIFAEYKTANPGQDNDGQPVHTIGGGLDPVDHPGSTHTEHSDIAAIV